jgi:hypothetical protein
MGPAPAQQAPQPPLTQLELPQLMPLPSVTGCLRASPLPVPPRVPALGMVAPHSGAVLRVPLHQLHQQGNVQQQQRQHPRAANGHRLQRPPRLGLLLVLMLLRPTMSCPCQQPSAPRRQPLWRMRLLPPA